MTREQIFSEIKTYFSDKPVNKVSVFGSFARNEQKPNSDIDIVIEPAYPVGMFGIIKYKQELQKILNNEVDLLTEKGIDKYARPFIEKDSIVLYVR